MSVIIIESFEDIHRVIAALMVNDIKILEAVPHGSTFEAFAQDANSFTKEGAQSFIRACSEEVPDDDQ